MMKLREDAVFLSAKKEAHWLIRGPKVKPLSAGSGSECLLEVDMEGLMSIFHLP